MFIEDVPGAVRWARAVTITRRKNMPLQICVAFNVVLIALRLRGDLAKTLSVYDWNVTKYSGKLAMSRGWPRISREYGIRSRRRDRNIKLVTHPVVREAMQWFGLAHWQR